jgi:3-oxoadipate enol-lactonase
MPTAHAGDVELDYERAGTGEPLLMIMGLSGTYLHWGEPFLELLMERFEVIVYDHRGVGASSRVESPFTIADLARDASRLLDALELERVHLLGFSMGGMIAQELVLARPDAIGALVLASTYCGGPESHTAREATLRRLFAPMASGDREAALRAAWEVNVSPAHVGDAAAYERFRDIAARRRVAVRVIMEQLNAISQHDTSGRLGAIEAPSLVVHGTADTMVPPENAPVIARLIPHARLELLPGAGHLFFWEDPERAAALVGEHLAGSALSATGATPGR